MNSLDIKRPINDICTTGAWYDYSIFDSENIQLGPISREDEELVICKICGKKLEIISPTHLKKHNITVKQYLEFYPNEKISSKKRNKKITEAQLGTIFSEERKNNLSKALTGIPKSEEHKRKIKEEVNTPERKKLNKDSLLKLKKEGKGWYSKESREKAMIKKIENKKVFQKGFENVAKRDDVREKIRISKIKFWSDEDNVKKRIKTWRQNLSDGKFKMVCIPFYNAGSGYKEDIKIYVRSRIEANVIRVLKYLNIEFVYEPKTYLLKNNKGEIINSYLPDLYIKEKDLFIEIKPEWYGDGKEKYDLFKEQITDKIVWLDRYFYDLISYNYSKFIPNWEWKKYKFEIALRDYDQGKIENLEDIVRTLQRCKENSRNDYSDLTKLFKLG